MPQRWQIIRQGRVKCRFLSIDPVSGDNTVELLFISANKVEEGDFFWFEKEMAEYSESGAGKVCEKI